MDPENSDCDSGAVRSDDRHAPPVYAMLVNPFNSERRAGSSQEDHMLENDPIQLSYDRPSEDQYEQVEFDQRGLGLSDEPEPTPITNVSVNFSNVMLAQKLSSSREDVQRQRASGLYSPLSQATQAYLPDEPTGIQNIFPRTKSYTVSPDLRPTLQYLSTDRRKKEKAFLVEKLGYWNAITRSKTCDTRQAEKILQVISQLKWLIANCWTGETEAPEIPEMLWRARKEEMRRFEQTALRLLKCTYETSGTSGCIDYRKLQSMNEGMNVVFPGYVPTEKSIREEINNSFAASKSNENILQSETDKTRKTVRKDNELEEGNVQKNLDHVSSVDELIAEELQERLYQVHRTDMNEKQITREQPDQTLPSNKLKEKEKKVEDQLSLVHKPEEKSVKKETGEYLTTLESKDSKIANRNGTRMNNNYIENAKSDDLQKENKTIKKSGTDVNGRTSEGHRPRRGKEKNLIRLKSRAAEHYPLHFLILRWKKLYLLIQSSRATLSEDLIDAVDKYITRMCKLHETKVNLKRDFEFFSKEGLRFRKLLLDNDISEKLVDWIVFGEYSPRIAVCADAEVLIDELPLVFIEKPKITPQNSPKRKPVRYYLDDRGQEPLGTISIKAETERNVKDKVPVGGAVTRSNPRPEELAVKDDAKKTRTVSPDRSVASCARLLERLREQIRKPFIKIPRVATINLVDVPEITTNRSTSTHTRSMTDASPIVEEKRVPSILLSSKKRSLVQSLSPSRCAVKQSASPQYHRSSPAKRPRRSKSKSPWMRNVSVEADVNSLVKGRSKRKIKVPFRFRFEDELEADRIEREKRHRCDKMLAKIMNASSKQREKGLSELVGVSHLENGKVLGRSKDISSVQRVLRKRPAAVEVLSSSSSKKRESTRSRSSGEQTQPKPYVQGTAKRSEQEIARVSRRPTRGRPKKRQSPITPITEQVSPVMEKIVIEGDDCYDDQKPIENVSNDILPGSSLELGPDLMGVVRENLPAGRKSAEGKSCRYMALFRSGVRVEVSEGAYLHWITQIQKSAVLPRNYNNSDSGSTFVKFPKRGPSKEDGADGNDEVSKEKEETKETEEREEIEETKEREETEEAEEREETEEAEEREETEEAEEREETEEAEEREETEEAEEREETEEAEEKEESEEAEEKEEIDETGDKIFGPQTASDAKKFEPSILAKVLIEPFEIVTAEEEKEILAEDPTENLPDAQDEKQTAEIVDPHAELVNSEQNSKMEVIILENENEMVEHSDKTENHLCVLEAEGRDRSLVTPKLSVEDDVEPELDGATENVSIDAEPSTSMINDTEKKDYGEICVKKNKPEAVSHSWQNKKLVVQRDYLRKIAEQSFICRMHENWTNVPEGGPSDEKINEIKKGIVELQLCLDNSATTWDDYFALKKHVDELVQMVMVENGLQPAVVWTPSSVVSGSNASSPRRSRDGSSTKF